MTAAVPAQAFTVPTPPWAICAGSTTAAEGGAQHTLLGPPNGATVTAGTPVTFFGESSPNHGLTFSVASSPALLSSPDIDGGLGTLQPGPSWVYAFTSTKAAATPRTIYWEASFTFTPEDCEGPATFTTPVYTLIVVPTEAELAAIKRQQEEAATKKKIDEEVTAKKKREAEEAEATTVSLDGSIIDVQSTHEAAVKLTCAGTATCGGKLTLTAAGAAAKSRKKHIKTETIGTTTFTVAAGNTGTIDLTLNSAGRALLSAAHARLGATLTIIKTSPAPSQTHTEDVGLVQQKSVNPKKPARRLRYTTPSTALSSRVMLA